nr:hypothetical protein [Tanacetum cinerariifolium]
GRYIHDRFRTEMKMAKKLRQDELCMNGQEFDITTLDSAVRENRFKNSNMMKLITGFQEEPSIHTAPVLLADDPYVMVRDAAMDTRGDEDVNTDAPRDIQPSDPHGSPCHNFVRQCNHVLSLVINEELLSFDYYLITRPKRRSQTNPQPTLTQEAVDQLVRDGIEAAIRDERERVRREAIRAGGPVTAPMVQDCSFAGFMKCGPMQFHGTKSVVGLIR